MKSWILSSSLIVSLLVFSGCGTPTPATQESVKIDPTLPRVDLTKHGVISGMKSVAFEWKSIKDPRVKGIYIYKKSPATESAHLEFYKAIETRFKTHFVDMNVVPGSEYTYMFKVYSAEAEAKKGQSITVKTLPVLGSVSWIHSVTDMPRTAKIIWRPHSNEKVKSYIVERKTVEDISWEKLAEVEGRLSAEYLDVDLKDNYIYMYRVRVLTYDDIASTPSEIVKVVTKALPKSVENIRATKELPRAIKLTWKKANQRDFKQYYLYRSSSIDGSYTLIAQLYNNVFTDKIEDDGKIFFYRVSIVDTDDLQSKYEEHSVQGMTLIKPSAPAIIDSKYLNNKILITWSKTDPRSVKYTVTRKYKKGWFEKTTKDFTNIESTQFTDKNIEADSAYTYVVYAIDKNGIKSEASIEANIITPESNELMGVKQSTASSKKERVSSAQDSAKIESEDIIVPNEDLDLSGL